MYKTGCLMCDKEQENDTLLRLLFSDDPICGECRSQWQKHRKREMLDDIPMEALWQYNGAFSSCLLQFKELHDEALKDVFLYPFVNRLRHRYRGYTLLLMPSSREKQEERGFSHLKEMFECLHLPMLEPFIKESSRVQKALGRKGRMEMEHSILRRKEIELPKKILLVDDVCTTGSTLRGALHTLKKEDHTVRILTAAIVSDPHAALSSGVMKD